MNKEIHTRIPKRLGIVATVGGGLIAIAGCGPGESPVQPVVPVNPLATAVAEANQAKDGLQKTEEEVARMRESARARAVTAGTNLLVELDNQDPTKLTVLASELIGVTPTPTATIAVPTATRTPEPTQTAVPTATVRPVEPTATARPLESQFPDFISRPLKLNEWNLVQKGDVIAGDIRTGEKKLHDEDRSTGLVTVPEQTMYVWGEWGATIWTPRNPNNPDAVKKLTDAVVNDMLRDGCGTGIGCPGGVMISDGFAIISWRLPSPK